MFRISSLRFYLCTFSQHFSGAPQVLFRMIDFPMQLDPLREVGLASSPSWGLFAHENTLGKLYTAAHCGNKRGNGVVPLPLNKELRKISNGKHWSMASNAKVAHRIGTACSGTGQQLGRKMLKGMMSIVEAYRWDWELLCNHDGRCGSCQIKLQSPYQLKACGIRGIGLEGVQQPLHVRHKPCPA